MMTSVVIMAKIDEAPLSDHKFFKQINHRKCGTVSKNRIAGGSIAGIGSMPWMVLMFYKSKKIEGLTGFKCGGSLITTKFVLTAAHCSQIRDFEL